MIRWTAKPRPGEAAAHETTGHVWDDDLTEYNQPMPRWWLYLFYITIVFALAYLVLFPGLGRYDGVLGWSQYSKWEQEVAAMREQTAELYESYAATPVPELAGNQQAMETGRRSFTNNCAVCHRLRTGVARGVMPNLADDSWQYGSDPDTIKATLINGRNGVMPAFGDSLSRRQLEQVSAYVYTLTAGMRRSSWRMRARRSTCSSAWPVTARTVPVTRRLAP
ncbi:MAG: cbb3-type cytochrome c oxidase N-terminal domain-containing protein [Arhodomonas sp.]|nr:cbb3-type cytochrome c oxidase N-terminal domain-containing protein [Arhodomonas sp.]